MTNRDGVRGDTMSGEARSPLHCWRGEKEPMRRWESLGSPTPPSPRMQKAKRMKYRTIVADPPWPIKWRFSPGIGTRHLDYATMPIAEIAALPISDLADDACSVFLWTTNQFLPEALGIMRLWKFEYRFLWTWCKPTGLGGHPRIATEHIVVATRGPVRQQLDRRAPQTLNWAMAPTTAHSVKPEKFLDLIESVSEGPYLELFARRQRIGWDTWGDEALEHVTLPASALQEARLSAADTASGKGDVE